MTVGYAASAGYGAMVATQVSRQMQSGSTSTTGTSTKTTSRYQTGKTQETVVHSLTDSGTGGLGDFGSVNYAGKTLTVRLVELDAKTEGYKADHESAAAFETTSMGAAAAPAAPAARKKAANTATTRSASSFWPPAPCASPTPPTLSRTSPTP